MNRPIRKTRASLLAPALILGLCAPAVFAAQDDLLRAKAKPFETSVSDMSLAFENLPKFKPDPGPANVRIDEVPGDRCVRLTLKSLSHYVCEEVALTLAGSDLYVSLIGTRQITKAAVTQTQAKISLNPTQVTRLDAAQKELFAKDPHALLRQMDIGFTGLDPASSQNPVIGSKNQAAFSKRVAADFAGSKRHGCSEKICYLDENQDPITAEEIMDLHFQRLQDAVVDILKRHASKN